MVKAQNSEKGRGSNCDVGASKNAVTHFLRSDYLYIWYLKSFRGSVRWQPAKRILGGFLFQILGGEKGRVPKISFPAHRLFYTVFSKLVPSCIKLTEWSTKSTRKEEYFI